MRAFSLLIGVSLALVSCDKLADDFRDSTTSSAIEAAFTTINGILDETADEGFGAIAPNWSSTLAHFFENQFGIPFAWAAACSGRAAGQPCAAATTGGTRTRSYDSCSLAQTQFTMQGTVTLTYTDENCALDDQDTVTRTVDIRRTGPFGGYTRTTSEAHSTYDGTAIPGGGAQLKKVLVGYEVGLIGIHKIRVNSKAEKLFDISLKTLTPFAVTGLTRATREMTGGRVRLYQNSAAYTAEIVVSETLRFEPGCCYPKSGKLTYASIGVINEQGSVVFAGCGSGTMKVGSTETAFSFASCE